jgi:ferredoxin/flavodoxin---NADP+ reductase
MVVDNKGKVTYIQVIKEDLAIFHIAPDNGPIPDFKAGQFVTLGLHVPSEGKIIRRAYSIASAPEQKKRFELYIRWVRKPVYSRSMIKCPMEVKIIAEWFLLAEGQDLLRL